MSDDLLAQAAGELQSGGRFLLDVPGIERSGAEAPQPEPTHAITPATPASGNPEPPAFGGHADDVIAEAEAYLRSYLSFPDGRYFLPLALFAALMHCWGECFDEVPYLSVGAAVKSAGKTRVLELLSFLAGEEKAVLLDGSITEAALYAEIAERKTILIDESERLRTPRSPLRPILNGGYRRGQFVYRRIGGRNVKFSNYCPKVFSHLGDVYDSLRDRCILVQMQRTMGGARKEYCRAVAQQEGSVISVRLHDALSARVEDVRAAYRHDHELYRRLGFLRDRDREIWLPLFSLCQVLAPSRILELERSAADIAALKTVPARPFETLVEEERESEEMEYAERLLADAIFVTAGIEKISTAELARRLRELPTSPWRRYRGTGITEDAAGAMLMASLLRRFGIEPKTIRLKPKGEPNSTAKGYTLADLAAGSQRAGLRLCGGVGRNPEVEEPTAKGEQEQQKAAEGKRIITKELWESFTPDEQQAYRQTLFISRGKATEPWPVDDWENYLNDLLGYYRVVGLPHYRLTAEEKKKKLKSLLKFDHSSLYRDGVVYPTMHALGLAWSYFPHMWGVRCNGMLTPEEVFNDDTLFMKAIKKRMKLGTYISDGGIRKAIKSFSGVQAPSNFRPTAAAAIYHHFLPEEGGVTWDMSSGFGGRLLGAMACSRVLKYIGTEPSTPTMEGLQAMMAELLPMLPELKPERPKLEVELHHCGSEDFKPEPESVDLAFTSPPYFDCERYSTEETQSYIKFPSQDKWLHGFMKQTLANCWRALKPDGHLIINIAGVKTYPQLVTDFKQLAENNRWESTGEAGLKLFKMMGTRKTKDGYEVMKTEPLLIFRKTPVHDELEDFVPTAFVPGSFIPAEHGAFLAAN